MALNPNDTFWSLSLLLTTDNHCLPTRFTGQLSSNTATRCRRRTSDNDSGSWPLTAISGRTLAGLDIRPTSDFTATKGWTRRCPQPLHLSRVEDLETRSCNSSQSKGAIQVFQIIPSRIDHD